MKIVFTTASYYPNKDGVQYVTQYEAEGLSKLGHDVTVITSDKNGCDKFDYHNGVRILRLNAYNKHFLHFGNKKEFQNTVLTEVENADVMINVCLQSFAADWVLKILNRIKCKKVLIMHGMHNFHWENKDFDSINSFLLKLLRNIRWRLFYLHNWHTILQYDLAIHLHENDYSYLYFQKKRFKNNVVLYNAVDNGFFENANDKQDWIINVGSYNERKNQIAALSVFYQATTNNYKLILIGNTDNAYYRKLIEYKTELDKKYGYKQVDIICGLDREQTITIIKQSKIYLLTSKWEAFPISLIEAMASGSAYISSDVGIVKTLPGGVVCSTEKDMINALSSYISDGFAHYALEGKEYAEKNMMQTSQVIKLEKYLEEY